MSNNNGVNQMNYLDTMETEYHDFDQAEINAQQRQIEDDEWAEIEAEAERIRIERAAK